MNSRFAYSLGALGFVVGLAACSEQGLVSPTPPYPGPPSDLRTVSGTVWVHGATGVEPARDGAVFGWLQARQSGQTTGPVPIGADGRYEFGVPSTVTHVFVQGPGYQPCVTTVRMVDSSNQVADLDVISDPRQLGAHLPGSLSSRVPTLSGVVYEHTAEGRRPIPNAWVTLDGLGGMGLVIADTRTDEEGRYVFCAVPNTAELAVVGSADGFGLFESYDVAGKTTLDFELRR